MQLQEVCRDAREIIEEAVQFIRKESGSFTIDRVQYKGFNDLVSYVDKNAEQILVRGLQNLIPGCGFIAEESSVAPSKADYQWIVDPLDGTTNFVHGLAPYCVSVGLMHNGKMVAGIIHEVNLNECFYGWKNGGAWLNEKRISVSKTKTLSKSLIATGFPYTNYERMQPYMNVFDWCMRNTQGLRRLGSAAADLAYVAAGRMEAFYEYGLNAWDVAAGALLVEEAGGKVSDFSGNTNYIFGQEIITTNSLIFEDFLKVIKKEFQ